LSLPRTEFPIIVDADARRVERHEDARRAAVSARFRARDGRQLIVRFQPSVRLRDGATQTMNPMARLDVCTPALFGAGQIGPTLEASNMPRV